MTNGGFGKRLNIGIYDSMNGHVLIRPLVTFL